MNTAPCSELVDIYTQALVNGDRIQNKELEGMSTYQKLIRLHLGRVRDDFGISNEAVADALGLNTATDNYISMFLGPKGKAVFPPARLPALAKLARLSSEESLELLQAYCETRKEGMTMGVLRWIAEAVTTVAVKEEIAEQEEAAAA